MCPFLPESPAKMCHGLPRQSKRPGLSGFKRDSDIGIPRTNGKVCCKMRRRARGSNTEHAETHAGSAECASLMSTQRCPIDTAWIGASSKWTVAKMIDYFLGIYYRKCVCNFGGFYTESLVHSILRDFDLQRNHVKLYLLQFPKELHTIYRHYIRTLSVCSSKIIAFLACTYVSSGIVIVNQHVGLFCI